MLWQNPQFCLTLLEEDDDPSDPEKTCSFLVALMQKHSRRSGVQLAIGLHVYKVNTLQTHGHTQIVYVFILFNTLRIHRPVIYTLVYRPKIQGWVTLLLKVTCYITGLLPLKGIYVYVY